MAAPIGYSENRSRVKSSPFRRFANVVAHSWRCRFGNVPGVWDVLFDELIDVGLVDSQLRFVKNIYVHYTGIRSGTLFPVCCRQPPIIKGRHPSQIEWWRRVTSIEQLSLYFFFFFFTLNYIVHILYYVVSCAVALFYTELRIKCK